MTWKRVGPPPPPGQHDWRPNATLSVYHCQRCALRAFAPHPLPQDTCPLSPGAGGTS